MKKEKLQLSVLRYLYDNREKEYIDTDILLKTIGVTSQAELTDAITALIGDKHVNPKKVTLIHTSESKEAPIDYSKVRISDKGTAHYAELMKSKKNDAIRLASLVLGIPAAIAALIAIFSFFVPSDEPTPSTSPVVTPSASISTTPSPSPVVFSITATSKDTISDEFEPAKKITVTTSADIAERVTITSKSSTGEYGPIDFDKVGTNTWEAIVVFYIKDEYDVTLTAYGSDGEEATTTLHYNIK